MFWGDFTNWTLLINALGWALTHFIWQGFVIGFVYWLGQYALRTARPGWRYGFGLGCMALLLMVPILTGYSIYQSSLADSSPSTTFTLPVITENLPVTEQNKVGIPITIKAWIERNMPYVVMIWFFGVLLMSMRVGLNWCRMLRLTRIGVRPLSLSLQQKTESLIALFGVRRTVRIFESTLIKVPTMFGWLKPVILLPSSCLTGLSVSQLELIIAHELGHIRRFDYLVNLLQVFIETLLFYHPMVRWVSQQVRNEREKCCDDLVIDCCGERLEYAKALNKVAMFNHHDSSPALGATDGQLVQRIERIVCQHTQRPNMAQGNIFLVLLVTVVFIIAGRTSRPLQDFDEMSIGFGQRVATEILLNRLPAQTDALIQPLAEVKDYFTSDTLSSDVDVPAQTSEAYVTETKRQHLVLPESPFSVAAPRKPAVRPKLTPILISPPVLERQLDTKELEVAEELNRITLNLEFDSISLQLQHELANRSLPRAQIPDLPLPENIAQVTGKQEETRTAVKTSQLSMPKLVKQVIPIYPKYGRYTGRNGVVVVEFNINKKGRPVAIKIIEGKNYTLKLAAKKALRAWRFDPDQSAAFTDIRYKQTFDFSLQEQLAKESQQQVAKQQLKGGNKRLTATRIDCFMVTGSRLCRRGGSL